MKPMTALSRPKRLAKKAEQYAEQDEDTNKNETSGKPENAKSSGARGGRKPTTGRSKSKKVRADPDSSYHA